MFKYTGYTAYATSTSSLRFHEKFETTNKEINSKLFEADETAVHEKWQQSLEVRIKRIVS